MTDSKIKSQIKEIYGKQTDRQTEKQAIKQIYRKTNRQDILIGREIHRQTKKSMC